MLCCPEVGILCIALERKEVSKMAQYVVDMQMEKQEKFYFIREKESMDIVLLPSKYLMHKKRSRISPNTIRRSAFALSYYLNYMDENQLHLDDVYQMKYAEQHEHFTDFLIWLKAGEHSREEYSKLPNNETCNAYLKEVFRFYTFMERENGQSESLKVLSDAQTIVRNSVGVRRVLNRKSFHGYLKEKGHQGKTIEQDKIVSLLQECANCRDQVLLLLLAETGFRIGELLGVRYGEDIDYKNHLLSDGGKRIQVETLALAIASGFLIPPAAAVIEAALIFCWAFAESILDVRELFAGGHVPLIKNSSDWQLSLSNLPNILDKLDSSRKDAGNGMSYEDYLQVLLMAKGKQDKVLRGMDMIECSVREKGKRPGFQMDHCITALEASADVKANRRKIFTVTRQYMYE